MTFNIRFQALVFFAFWLLTADINAQDTCVYLFTIPQKADFATVDNLSNTYLLKGFEAEKYDSTGKFVSRYSNNRLGTPAFLDASNPLKLLVWYADFQTAVFLDRNMTELGRLNLLEAGFPAVRRIAMAFDGNLWAYDEASSQLFKLSASGEKILESQPLNLEFVKRFAPTCIRDDGGQGVYISDPAQSLAAFNPYGQFDKTLPFNGLENFEVIDGTLYFTEPGGIRAQALQGFSSRKIAFASTMQLKGVSFWLSKQKILVLTDAGVEIYRF